MRNFPSKDSEFSQTTKYPKTYTLNKLPQNHKLCQNSFIMSQNQQFFARLQEDGNFVVYKTANFNPKNAIWATNAYGKGEGPYVLLMKKEGKFVVYDKNNKEVWSSNSNKIGKHPYNLFLFDNGKLGIIDGENNLIWENKI